MPPGNTRASDPAALEELATGWPTLLGSAAAVATGAAMFVYVAGYFVKPMQAALGWSRADIAVAAGVTAVMNAAGMPISGSLSDRFGPRYVGVAGTLGYGLMCLVLAVIPAKLGVYYAAMALTALFYSATVANVYAPLVASKFKRLRGLALAVLMSGQAVLLAPGAQLFVRLIKDHGWRTGYAALGALALLFGLPCVFLGTRGGGPVKARHETHSGHGLSLGQAMKTFSYWKLVIAVLAATLPLGGFLHQLAAMLSDKGLTLTAVAGLGSLYVIMVVVGRALVGLLMDLLPPTVVSAGLMVLAAIGAAIMGYGGGAFAACAAATALVGSGMGGNATIEAVVSVRAFGLKSYATIFGTLAMTTSIGLGFGPFIFAKLHDTLGDYRLALNLSVASFLLAGMLYASTAARRLTD